MYPSAHLPTAPARRRPLAALLLTLVWLLPAAPTQAQTEPTPTDSDGRDETSAGAPAAPAASVAEEVFVRESLPYAPTSNTIATKLPVALEWTPAHVGVVDLALIAEQDALVLSDALENVSGLNVQTGNGVFDFFVVRGFDSLSSGLILIDGAPEPETTFYQLYNAERVEVLKGPGGFLYGPNPLAGAVNLVRKQPAPARFGLAGVTFGSFGTAEATADYNTATADGALSFRLNGLYRETDGWRDGRSGEVHAINPAVTWRPNERTSLNVNFELLSSDYRPDAGLPLLGGELIAGIPRQRSYGSPSDLSEQDVTRFQVDFEHTVSDRVTLRNKLYSRQLDWLSRGTLINGVLVFPTGGLVPGPTEGLVFRTLVTLDDAQSFWGDQLEAVVDWDTGAINHRILAGVELQRATDDYTLDIFGIDPISLANPVEAGNPPFPAVPSSAGDSETTTVAPYLVDQIRLNERWQVLVGARYDAIDFKDAITGTKRDDGKLSPMAGVTFAPRPGTALYANVGRSFAPPSVRVVGDRDPEESRQVELGLRQSALGGRLSASLAAYEIERTNIAIPDDNGFTQQAGDQRSRGVELEVTARPAPGWSTAFAYAYTDSELTRFAEQVVVGQLPTGQPVFMTFDRSGNRSAFAPEHLANLWVSKRINDRFTLGLGGRWVADQFISEDNSAQIDSYGLLSASASYTVNDWRLTLHLDNLTDQEYETRGFGSTAVIPGAPFAAKVGVEFRF